MLSWFDLLIIFIFVPCKLVIFGLITSFYLNIYKLIYYKNKKSEIGQQFWDLPIKQIAKFFYFSARIFYDYEAEIDRIPDKGPGVIVLYHGLTGCDILCLFSQVLLQKGRRIHITIDNRMFKIPGIKTILEALGALKQNRDQCVKLLKQGELIAMYPGGADEFFFSDENYKVVWGEHKGFARIAIETKSKIIPMFTKNSREMHGYLKFFNDDISRRYYKNIKFPIGFIIWGWFPVKMKTYAAEPIEYDETKSVENLVELTKSSVENLIEKYQHRPGNILTAVLERFECLFLNKNL